jgi:hypothetical protein
MDPVILYKGNERRAIPAIDASAWEVAGWKRNPDVRNAQAQELAKDMKPDGQAQELIKDTKPIDNLRKKTPTSGEMLETLEQLKKTN